MQITFNYSPLYVRLHVVTFGFLNLCCWVSTYLITYYDGRLKLPFIYLSSTISLDYGRAVGSFFIPFISLAAVVIQGGRLAYLKDKYNTKPLKAFYWIQWALVYISAIAMVAVGACTSVTNTNWHKTFADITFLGWASVAICSSAADLVINLKQHIVIKVLRWFFALSSMALSIAFIVLGETAPTPTPIDVLNQWISLGYLNKNKFQPVAGDPDYWDAINTWLTKNSTYLQSASTEVAGAACFILYFLTYVFASDLFGSRRDVPEPVATEVVEEKRTPAQPASDPVSGV